jgi:anti-anti-sigma factor
MNSAKYKSSISQFLLDSTATIKLSGGFSYRDRRAFEANYQKIISNPATEKLIVDFTEVERIDSSALGMLLVLRNHTEETKKNLHLANPSDVVRNVFEIACFNKLFTISNC